MYLTLGITFLVQCVCTGLLKMYITIKIIDKDFCHLQCFLLRVASFKDRIL